MPTVHVDTEGESDDLSQGDMVEQEYIKDFVVLNFHQWSDLDFAEVLRLQMWVYVRTYVRT